MKTALITGASTGLGREFLSQCITAFPEIEKYIIIARREERLESLKAEFSSKIIVCLPLDLCDETSFQKTESALASDELMLLINNAGCGYHGSFSESKSGEQLRMIDLNLRALVAVTRLSLERMPHGGIIINISSIASFCPTAEMTVYSSTKAFVTSFSRGLHEELRHRGISVTAVCPGPMDTEFLTVGHIKGNSKTFETLPYCIPEKVVAGAIKAAKKRHPVYTPTFFYKLYRLLAKLLPHRIVVKFAKT